jgi:asparagine synthase (glutamine-hydrolysing)
MELEKFYVSGTYFAPELGIYAGWVALPGSFAARQVQPTGDVALICSGEFTPEKFEPDDEHFVEHLNGLFSGLLIDRRRRRALLFNDRYGVERIYWRETADALYFASEAKALLRVLPETRAFDEHAAAQFVTYGCTLDWRTLFRNIQLLPGGSCWLFENGGCQKGRYFQPGHWESQSPLAEAEFESQFHEIFRRVLPRYFGHGDRIGISLTGGLDTRMIMACRPESSERPICYTFAGPKEDTMDVRLATEIAKICGLEHHVLRIGPDFFSNFAAYADRTVYATDGCFGILGAHEIYFHEQARRLAPIRLTGNYGSEILRGMSTFKPTRLARELFNPEFGRLVDSVSRQPSCHPVTMAAFEEIPWNLFGNLMAGRSQVTFRTPYLDNEIVALAFRAPESMRTSPLPATRLIRASLPALGRIPTDRGVLGENRGLSVAWRRFCAALTFKLDYLHHEGWPAPLALLDRVPWIGTAGGHKFLPYRWWFRRELAGYLNDALADGRIADVPFWSPAFIRSLAQHHTRGNKNYVREINVVLTLGALQRLFFQDN